MRRLAWVEILIAVVVLGGFVVLPAVLSVRSLLQCGGDKPGVMVKGAISFVCVEEPTP